MTEHAQKMALGFGVPIAGFAFLALGPFWSSDAAWFGAGITIGWLAGIGIATHIARIQPK